jgi:hypothetical protein
MAASFSLTNAPGWRERRLRTARDQLLSSPRLAIDPDGRIAGRNSLYLFQDAAERFASADDFFESQLASDLVFQLQLFQASFCF